MAFFSTFAAILANHPYAGRGLVSGSTKYPFVGFTLRGSETSFTFWRRLREDDKKPPIRFGGGCVKTTKSHRYVLEAVA